MLIGMRDLTLSYGGKQVLEGFSFDLPLDGVVGFTGPSGCGKTTLLRVLAGLEKVSSGEVSGPAPGECAVLFQENRLLPWRTVEQHITDVLPRSRQGEVDYWLSLAELEEERGLRPAALSGGMARRLAVARCGALGGSVLFLDEPFTGVDSERAARMLSGLKQGGDPILLVSHEDAVLSLCDRVYAFDGPPLRLI